ncbi:MAG: SRPBCC family protein [Actinomycetota bacterium]
MKQLLERTFPVETTPARAWEVVADAEHWPVWARHLRKVETTPPGPVRPGSTAVVFLRDFTQARVAVTRYVEGESFRWDGHFLWLRLGYDHAVHASLAGGWPEVRFTVWGDGIGAGSIGRVFAWVYARRLDRQIPRLQRLLAHQAAPTSS